MPLHIIREDITRMTVDVIVAAGSAKPGVPAPTGGVNGSIHRKAGERLLAALRRLGGIRAGGAALTEAYDLPCRYVIHTAGPVWQGGGHGEEAHLRSCYREALHTAQRNGLESIAFPLISAGTYGYPKAEAMRIAISEIRSFLNQHDLDVYLVVYDREAFRVSSTLFTGVKQFIDQHYVDAHAVLCNTREDIWPAEMAPLQSTEDAADGWSAPEEAIPVTAPWPPEPTAEPSAPCAKPPATKSARPVAKKAKCAAPDLMQMPSIGQKAAVPPGLARQLHQLDEGFAQMLLRLIDEKGMKDSVCYRKANVDRKLFNKIKNTPGYTPKKSTVAAFCVALELDMPHACELLSRAGYALSHSSIFDVIVEYFIISRVYDVDVINQALFAYDQPLLGSNVG